MTWPFATWGPDIVGPFKEAPTGFTHLLVGIDKFTMWVEVEVVTTTKLARVIMFLNSIFIRFGTPWCIITDNGPQFTSDTFKGFASDLGIQINYASIYHP